MALIFENQHFRIEQCLGCQLPGYLILSPVKPVCFFSDMSPEFSANLGVAISVSVAAVEKVLQPENVYVARFGEETREIHFHIFPRTKELTEAYRRENGGGSSGLSGPLLFDWARKNFAGSTKAIADAKVLEVMALIAREIKMSMG